MTKKNKTFLIRLSATGLCLALCWLLPLLTGQIPEIGNMLSPMHFPVILCGFFSGPWFGLILGFIAPLTRSLIFGMPVLFPSAFAMAFELAANKANICFVGTPTKEMSFSVKEWENMNRKEFTLTGSWMSYSAPFPGEEWKMTAHYFKIGELKFDDSFIFRKIPLSKIDTAFEMYKTPGAVKGKILIDSEA